MKNWLLVFCCCISQLASAQTWYPLGKGLLGQQGLAYVNCFAVDSINHLLYVGGDIYYAGDTISPNLAIWDGSEWQTTVNHNLEVASPVKAMFMKHDTLVFSNNGGIGEYYNHEFLNDWPPFGSVVNSFCFYHDTLYAGGNGRVKKWDGQKWISLGDLDGAVLSMCVYQDHLYIGGIMDSVNHKYVNNFASWDGHTWNTSLPGVYYSAFPYNDQIEAMTVYNGKLIIGGYFDHAGNLTVQCLAQWDGKNWISMPGLCNEVKSLYLSSIYGLYAGGNFVEQDYLGCFATGAAHYQNNKWNDLGLESLPIFSLTFFNNDLIAAGHTDVFGDIVCGSIAGLKDGVWTSIDEAEKQDFHVYPNPANDQLTVSFPFSNNIITISDLFGRELRQWKMESGKLKMVDVNFLHQGVYVVEIKDEKGNVITSEKLFKE